MKKTDIEIRYKDNLLFFNELFKISNKLVKYFPDWETDGTVIILKNKNEHISCMLEHNRTLFHSERKMVEEGFLKLCSEAINEYMDSSENKNITRVGVRSAYIQNTEFKHKELVMLFQEKFYSNDEELQGILSKSFNAFYMGVGFEKSGHKFHYFFAPVNKNDGINRFRPQYPIKTDSLTETLLYLDIDSYEEQIKSDNIGELLKKLSEDSQEIVDKSMKLFIKKK